MNIYLTGMPGSGKTTFGKRLAKAMGFTFCDLDVLITEHEKKPVTEIFAQQGETYFRQLESELLKKTLSYTHTIIATGGGTPCFFDNMQWMCMQGITIFLDVTLPELTQRLMVGTKGEQKRPLFANKTPEELQASLAAMRQLRLPYYEQARFHLGPHQIKTEVAMALLQEKAPQLFD